MTVEAEVDAMERTAVNPFVWGQNWAMNQAEVVEGITRWLHCSGQVALEDDPESPIGARPTHVGDMAGQIGAALASIDAILEEAGMDRTDLLSLRFFTTDVDAFLGAYEVYARWAGEAGIAPPQTLLGVARLALPELLVEIEAVAGR